MAGPWEDYAPAPSAGPWADYAPERPSPSLGAQAWDVAKQIPAGLVAGIEAIPAFPAQALGYVGGLVEKYVPGMAPTPEEAAYRKQLGELIDKQRGGGIEQYLPKPETTAGQYARTAAEFVPSTVAGARLAVPRAVGVGTTAGLVSEAGGQATEGSALEPYARVGGALLAGTMAGRLAESAATKSAGRQMIKATEAQAAQQSIPELRF